jgi:AbrB family looped-hinge helix DNA binding protein
MAKHNRLTIKGQVTIPKDVRDALGLKPGESVAFEKNEEGDYVLRKARIDKAEYETRYRAALEAIRQAHVRFPMDTFGMTTDEYMAMIREPAPLPEKS